MKNAAIFISILGPVIGIILLINLNEYDYIQQQQENVEIRRRMNEPIFSEFSEFPHNVRSSNSSPPAFNLSNNLWSEVLRKFVKNTLINGIHVNAVDYRGLRSSENKDLKTYLNQLKNLNFLDQNVTTQISTLINAYNAFIINYIVEHPCKILFGKFCWPIFSLHDLSGYTTYIADKKIGRINHKVINK